MKPEESQLRVSIHMTRLHFVCKSQSNHELVLKHPPVSPAFFDLLRSYIHFPFPDTMPSTFVSVYMRVIVSVLLTILVTVGINRERRVRWWVADFFPWLVRGRASCMGLYPREKERENRENVKGRRTGTSGTEGGVFARNGLG